jgi:hypothetical protein
MSGPPPGMPVWRVAPRRRGPQVRVVYVHPLTVDSANLPRASRLSRPPHESEFGQISHI